MSTAPYVTLNDGQRIPQLGLGVWRTPADTTAQTVQTALQAGYRHIDTAAIYGNEAGVGQGLQAAGVTRDQVYITTKVWNSAQGYDSTLKAFDDSMQLLGLEYLDLYLIHWPDPDQALYVQTWKALIALRKEGRIRSIGVSNFMQPHIERIVGETGVKPVIDQIELHPQFQQRELTAYLSEQDIAIEAWSPLGQGQLLAHPAIEAIAQAHGKSAAQIIIRWHVQQGRVVIPKSVTPSRIAENFAVFDFTLTAQELQIIDSLDKADGRLGPDPMNMKF